MKESSNNYLVKCIFLSESSQSNILLPLEIKQWKVNKGL